MRCLPGDAVLLSVSKGRLLVSPEFATFCFVPEHCIDRVKSALDGSGNGNVDLLPPELTASLKLHGFFDPPRLPAKRRAQLKLQLTNQCNLHCHYCCTNSGVSRPDELTARQWMSVLSEALEFETNGLYVGLLGGEPLLVPSALELAGTALDRAAKVTLFTNGVHLSDPTLAKQVAALCHRGAEVRVSLPGVTAAVCDGLSGDHRFEPALLGLRHLAEHRVTPRVDVMLFPETVSDVALGLAALRQRLPENSKVTLGLAFCGGREYGQHVFASRSDLESALDRITFEAGERVASPRTAPRTDRRDACHCGLGIDLNVRSDGEMFTCFRMEEQQVRYVPGMLAEFWQSARNHPRIARTTPACKGCNLVSLCGGGCRSENVLATGNGDVPDCGPWRVRVLCELLAEGCVAALEWSAAHLRAEAERRGFPVDGPPSRKRRSLHLL